MAEETRRKAVPDSPDMDDLEEDDALKERIRRGWKLALTISNMIAFIASATCLVLSLLILYNAKQLDRSFQHSLQTIDRWIEQRKQEEQLAPPQPRGKLSIYIINPADGYDGTTDTPSPVKIGDTVEITGFTVETTGDEPLYLCGLTFYQNGSATSEDIANIRLVDHKSKTVLATASMKDRHAAFNFKSCPKIAAKSAETFIVQADITGGSTRTINLSLQNGSSIAICTQDKNPMDLSENFTLGSDTNWLVINQTVSESLTNGEDTDVSLGTVTVASTIMTATANSSFTPSDNLAIGPNQKVGSFNLAASATEPIAVNDIKIQLNTVNSISNLVLKNGDTQLGEALASPSAAGNVFSVSGLVIPPSGTVIIDVYADIGAFAGILQAKLQAGGRGQTSGTSIWTAEVVGQEMDGS